MKFCTQLMSPSYSRHSGYDSLADENNGYKFECSQCEQKVFFPFAMLIGKEWSWENSYEKNVVVQIRDHFKMNIVGKTPDGGWPVISELTCQNCNALFMVYAGVKETSNSVYRVTIQSIVEIERD